MIILRGSLAAVVVEPDDGGLTHEVAEVGVRLLPDRDPPPVFVVFRVARPARGCETLEDRDLVHQRLVSVFPDSPVIPPPSKRVPWSSSLVLSNSHRT